MTVLLKSHGLLFVAGAVCILANGRGLNPLWFTGVALVVVGLVLGAVATYRQRPAGEQEPRLIPVPVTGRLMAVNGPATKVPSHTHSLAQTYAVDVKHVPAGDDTAAVEAPPFRWLWPVVRRPDAYPTFGRPLTAPADGTVVAASDRQRDHLTRTSGPGLIYLYAEGWVRSLGLPRHLLGNHLVLDVGDGVHAVFAHLRKGSVRVSAGERVTAGQQLAECGNSGNSSEPHLHFQLMDGPDVATAHGVPFAWHYRDDDGHEHTGVPEDFTHFTPTDDGRPTPRPGIDDAA
jgi:hypothetical protein